MIKKIARWVIKILLAFALATALFYVISWHAFVGEKPAASLGVTFSTVMARQLRLDPQNTFDAIINDLGVHIIRLPIYWQDINPVQGQAPMASFDPQADQISNGIEPAYNFTDYDYFIAQAEKHSIKLVLIVGRKLPRWPECHIPEWSQVLPEDKFEDAVDKYIEVVVRRYKSSPSVVAWQVENEPFHVFGSGCAVQKIAASSLDREVALVRSLDLRPIILTDSGEQGAWFTLLGWADLLGITMYRQVWNDVLGVTNFPFGPGFYKLKRATISFFFPKKGFIVSELQMEPWGPTPLPGYDIGYQKSLMNVVQFRKNVSYARRSGFDDFYLWGAEWWYWLGIKHNDWEIWDEAKQYFKEKRPGLIHSG